MYIISNSSSYSAPARARAPFSNVIGPDTEKVPQSLPLSLLVSSFPRSLPAPSLTKPRPGTLQGKTVLVKTNSGSDFKGILHCLDGFLNIALEHCEEWSNGECRRTYGDAFIRGNNVTFISLIGK